MSKGLGMKRSFFPAIAIATAFILAPARPALAQAPVETLDPARLAAAGKLIDVVMPPAQREAMIGAMVQALTSNMAKSMEANPDIAALFQGDARAREIFSRFMARSQSEAMAELRDSLPGMATAMARAYARRFTVAQMDELSVFFAAPTGRAYMAESMAIMSDPDVASWQQAVMAKTMSRIPAQVAVLTAELMALGPQAGKDGS